MAADKLEQVRKILAKAEARGVTAEEAEALTAKAAELMALHGIDRAMLAATEPQSDSITTKRVLCDTPWQLAKAGLLCKVADPMRVEAVIIRKAGRPGHTRYTYEVELLGFASDIERVVLLYTSLLLQAANAMQQNLEFLQISGNSRAAYHDSWIGGYGDAIKRRLREIEGRVAAQAADSMPGVALVLVDRKALVAKEAAAHWGQTETLRRSLSGGGRSAGYAAGERADLGNTARVSGKGQGAIR